MTISNGYASLAEFKAWITVRGGTISTDAADDAVMEDVVEQASRYIDEQTGRRFWKPGSDETRYYTPEDSTELEIDDLSTTPTSISVDYSGAETRAYTALASTDYDLLPENADTLSRPWTAVEIRSTSGDYFPTQRMGVKIVGKFGWPSVPDNIKNDCLSIAHNVWMGRQGQTGGGRMTITAAGIVIRPEDVPPMAQQDILTYRLYR
jgi:hypothetical protein